MKTGTARQGMRVRIIGDHNGHCFEIGQIVILEERAWGSSFYVREQSGYRCVVREIDMAPVGATLV